MKMLQYRLLNLSSAILTHLSLINVICLTSFTFVYGTFYRVFILCILNTIGANSIRRGVDCDRFPIMLSSALAKARPDV
ncbi:hypothetical protein T4D_12950 [Trichinella pseudospiralis]|uniref:Uncharacterized protein n=1 Tax=Trichinella pseudospiralis TaxID=6337 RepID=A0A0V1FK85_TRIPS|nr:hypothetical protein T4D_12950 [Trichinella pseudospiralis]